jgi:hypothetical protein
MYKKITTETMDGSTIDHIILDKGNDEFVSFPDVETNQCSERLTYLQWLEEGNEPLPWSSQEGMI